jgi:error-prone DNA polymerase
MVEGKLQREGEVVHVIVKRCFDLSKLLRKLTPSVNDDLPLLTLSRADEKSIPVIPKARNFK